MLLLLALPLPPPFPAWPEYAPSPPPPPLRGGTQHTHNANFPALAQLNLPVLQQEQRWVSPPQAPGFLPSLPTNNRAAVPLWSATNHRSLSSGRSLSQMSCIVVVVESYRQLSCLFSNEEKQPPPPPLFPPQLTCPPTLRTRLRWPRKQLSGEGSDSPNRLPASAVAVAGTVWWWGRAPPIS